MHEASLAFGSAFAATPLSRFRGSHNAPSEIEVNTVFLTAHFVIERHREALLWSWVVAKWGGTDGMLSAEKKMLMWMEIGGEDFEEVYFLSRIRNTVQNVEVNMRAAGLQPPNSLDRDVQADTKYYFSMFSLSNNLLETEGLS